MADPSPDFTAADARNFRKANIRGWRDRGLLIALAVAFITPAVGAAGLPWSVVGWTVLFALSVALFFWCAGLFFIQDWAHEGPAMAFFVLYNLGALGVCVLVAVAETYLQRWFGSAVFLLAPLPLIFEVVAMTWWTKDRSRS